MAPARTPPGEQRGLFLAVRGGLRAPPARQETDVSFAIEGQRDTPIREMKRELGRQVYGTNGVGMALPQAAWAYRPRIGSRTPGRGRRADRWG